MAAAGGIALKLLQWFIRGIQFGCAAVVLALFSYFLATLANHDLHIATWLRAVEGISGVAVCYTIAGLLLLCCLAGHPVTSFIAVVLDVAFVGGFIYVAWATRHGVDSCKGHVDTPFGSGDANTRVVDDGHGGVTRLPRLGTACRMETACFAVSIIAIIFFLLSILVEIALVHRRRKEKRFGPSPANNYTSGSGSTRRRRGLFGWRRNRDAAAAGPDPNALPAHALPAEFRQSYATDATRVGDGPAAAAYPKYSEADAGYGHVGAGAAGQPGYRYNDGVYNA